MHVLLLTIAKAGLLSSAGSRWGAEWKTRYPVGSFGRVTPQGCLLEIVRAHPGTATLTVEAASGDRSEVTARGWASTGCTRAEWEDHRMKAVCDAPLLGWDAN